MTMLELAGGVLLVAPLLVLAGWLVWRSGGPRPADQPAADSEAPESRTPPPPPASANRPGRPVAREPELSQGLSVARTFVTFLSMVLLACPGGPLLFMGFLGVSGQLSDTSERENLVSGLFFLAFGLLSVTPIVLCWFLWMPLRGSNTDRGVGD